ncbi:hypothetical protein ACFQV4_24865 [Streptomyces thermocarboxydus]
MIRARHTRAEGETAHGRRDRRAGRTASAPHPRPAAGGLLAATVDGLVLAHDVPGTEPRASPRSPPRRWASLTG